jgi:hypothetical protein
MQNNNKQFKRKKGKNSMNTAYEMGRRSFYDGRFTHPYKKETILAKEWQRGWDRSYFDQQKNPVFKVSQEELDRKYWEEKAEDWRKYFSEQKVNLN